MAGTQAERCRLPGAFWRAVERLSLQPASVLRQAGLPPGLHLSGRSIISVDQLFAIWTALETLSGDPGFGLRMASETKTAHHKVAFVAASYAATFGEALERIARFKRLCSPERMCFEQVDQTIAISSAWPTGTAQEPPLSADANFALLLELGRRGTGLNLKPAAVELRRLNPGTGQHESYFACPVRYGRDQDRLFLRKADLDLPFAGHNQELLAKLTPVLIDEMRDIEKPSNLSEHVKSALMEIMSGGSPTIRTVASAMGLSARTLQRRLTMENVTFRDLLADARRTYARRLLSDPAVDTSEVAFLLGFEDANSFYRAFRAWEDMTPQAWRSAELGRLRKLTGHRDRE